MLIISVGCRAENTVSGQPVGIGPVGASRLPTAPSSLPPARLVPQPTSAAPASPSPYPTSAPTDEPPKSTNKRFTIAPDDERILYRGRYDFSDPQRPAFDWSGVSIAFSFEGSSIAIRLNDGRNYYNVWIDDQMRVLETAAGSHEYVLAEGLAPGEHEVVVLKRTEAYVGAAVFEGLELVGSDLGPRPERSGRLIEFIGDSITTGYGNEGTSPDCYFTPATQNAEQTYAAFTAAQFAADYDLIALSGLGVVRNLREEGEGSANTAINHIDRALGLNPAVMWPSTTRTPDAVVINLGTNDFSSTPFPESIDFVSAYVELLRAVRQRYPSAYLVAVSGPLMLEPGPQLIAKAVAQFREQSNDSRTTMAVIENNLEESAVDFGCDWHPNVNGHHKIADQLAPVLATLLGWD
ncbi:MAG: GDSL-type esterase/lipase family protein [Candidatus Promineifilaceae bacterium]